MSYLEVVISTKARISMKMWMQVGRTYIPTTKDFRFFFADTVSGEITVRDQLVFLGGGGLQRQIWIGGTCDCRLLR